MEERVYDYSSARRVFSRVGFALLALLVITTGLQSLWFFLPGEDSWMVNSSWGYWLGSFLPLYLVAMPVAIAILRTLPAQAPEDHKLPGKAFAVLIPICFCVMYGGNLVGNLLSMLLSGGNAQNAVASYAMDTNPIKVLFLVILAPLLEELLCRKLIMDRTRQYGEKVAVVFSGMVFALMHQNFFQFFYAFGLGVVFAYVYLRTGRLRYSVILHAIINFIGGVVAPLVLSLMDPDALLSLDPNAPMEELMAFYAKILPGLLLTGLYSMVLMGLAIAGLVLIIVNRKHLLWKTADSQLQDRRVKTVYLNVGMVAYILLCAVSFVLALL